MIQMYKQFLKGYKLLFLSSRRVSDQMLCIKILYLIEL